jgi:hypothetical protein
MGNMKILLCATVIVMLTLSAGVVWADEVTSAINYQGRLADSSGSPLSGTYTMTFRLYEAATGGTALDMDIHDVVVTDGLFNTAIAFDTSYFDGRELWLGVTVGTDSEMTPRQELRPVPYALGLKPGACVNGGGSTTALMVSNWGGGFALEGYSTANTGIVGISGVYGPPSPPSGMRGVYGRSWGGVGVYGEGGHTGVYGNGENDGVKGESTDGNAVHGLSTNGNSVLGESINGNGVRGESSNEHGIVGKTGAEGKSGIYGWSASGKGVEGFTTTTNEWVPAIYGRNGGAGDGVYGWSQNRSGTVGVTYSSDGEDAGVHGINLGSPYGGAGVYGETSIEGCTGVYGEATGSSGVGVAGVGSTGVLAESTGGTALWAVVSSGYGTAVYGESGPSGGFAAKFKGNVQIQSRSTGATVIELGEGLDYAEGFDVTRNNEIVPGTVLIIDPDNPGRLAISTKPYDSKVAGIVAGAKGLGSGVRLGSDRFDYDVALAGRVYCNVDARGAGLEPGDLLTTSATQGYAMKATDYERAQGAILGKAMERLEEGGKGQILVLVTLQ